MVMNNEQWKMTNLAIDGCQFLVCMGIGQIIMYHSFVNVVLFEVSYKQGETKQNAILRGVI